MVMLSVGQRYVTRSGQRIELIEQWDGADGPSFIGIFLNGSRLKAVWSHAGIYTKACGTNPLDIVAFDEGTT